MKWRVMYTDQAKQDLKNIYEYIAYELLMPETANEQIHRIMKKVSALDEMPFRYKLFDDNPWYGQGMRVMPTDNYIVFYTADKNCNAVNIVRILYSRRNVPDHL